MNLQELRVKPISELQKLLATKREDLRAMRFKVAQRQLKKVHDIKRIKHLVARILTVIKEKEEKQ